MTLARKVLMVEPEHFEVNPEIVSDNFFLKNILLDKNKIRKNVLEEFSGLKTKLESAGIEVVSFRPHDEIPAPDAVFPNNWFSTHPDATLVFYPMMSPLRRNERQPEIISFLKSHSKKTIDLSENEIQNRFLEGTGSIVIEHKNKIAFASESSRTNASLFFEWCKIMNHTPVLFHATDDDGHPVYHTNVILTIAENFAILCSECIEDESEKEAVKEKLLDGGLKILEINFEQAKSFSGNALALKNKNGQALVISEKGWNGFNASQKIILSTLCSEIIVSPLPTIESCGGGSARCMLAELF